MYISLLQLVDFLTISPELIKHKQTIPGLYRGPPQDKGWDEDEQKNEGKNVTKNL